MKTLKFKDYLVPLVLSGEKDITWRIFDDKDLRVGDDLELLDCDTKEKFAEAKIVEVWEEKFKDIGEKDLAGHEKFESREEMLKTYQGYYGDEVNWDTVVKIIKFEIK